MTTETAPVHTNRIKTSLPPGYEHPPTPAQMASFLGLFSIGLGLAEALAPRTMSRATGVASPGLLRAYGLREIAAGIGILTSRRPAPWLWGRVAGDILDLATLGVACATGNGKARLRALAAAAAVAGVTALDVLCACEHGDDPR